MPLQNSCKTGEGCPKCEIHFTEPKWQPCPSAGRLQGASPYPRVIIMLCILMHFRAPPQFSLRQFPATGSKSPAAASPRRFVPIFLPVRVHPALSLFCFAFKGAGCARCWVGRKCWEQTVHTQWWRQIVVENVTPRKDRERSEER